MIFLQLFLSFCKIGIFTFGGGYSMIALIQNEVVNNYKWLTAEEFTDLLAISQMTPGPIGINTATYTGYTAIINSGYDTWLAVLGAFLASFAVILLPFLAMIMLCKILSKYQKYTIVQNIFRVLRLSIIGLIAAAALHLLTPENFGSWYDSPTQFIVSMVIFVGVFVASLNFKKSPILLLGVSGVVGLIFYTLF